MPRYFVLALVLIIAGCAQGADKTLDRTFTVSPGGTLTVEADGAGVHVAGNDGNQVIVHMRLRGSQHDLDNMTLDAVQTADGVTATMHKAVRHGFAWGIWSSNQNIDVTVPRHYAVKVRTGGGDVDMRDTVGVAS